MDKKEYKKSVENFKRLLCSSSQKFFLVNIPNDMNNEISRKARCSQKQDYYIYLKRLPILGQRQFIGKFNYDLKRLSEISDQYNIKSIKFMTFEG